MKPAFVALTVVSIWMVALLTAPQMLGIHLWSWFGFVSKLPLRHLLQGALSSIAVVSFILIVGKRALLVPEWPRDPRYVLLLVPLASVNLVLRGPLVELSLSFLLVAVASTFLTAFWEEFLFRGLIQDRLSVLGCRLSMLSTALLFSFPHGNKGLWPMLLAFSIGLVFSTFRNRVGLWALVLAHWGINVTVHVFAKPTWHYIYPVTAVYMVVGFVLLATMKNAGKSNGMERGA